MTNYLPKLLITGANGQLGTSLRHHPQAKNFQLISCSRADLDISDDAAVAKAIALHKPDMVINAAAYTAVDKAESEASQAMLINVMGAQNLAQRCEEARIPFLHLSTDYIFDGKQQHPYQETDTPNPVNVYGETKWRGEEAIRTHCEKHIILRISGVFSEFSNNFLKTMLRLANEKETLNIINDQITCPTYTADIAAALFTIANNPATWGTYHYCSNPPVSWFEFAVKIIAKAQSIRAMRVTKINPVTTEQYPTPAKRPAYSVLDCSKIKRDYDLTQPSWQQAIHHAVPTLVKEI